MKNKKLLKLLASLAMGGAMAVSVFGMAACGGKGGGDDEGDDPGIITPNPDEATVSSVTVSAADDADSVEVNKTLQLSAKVEGTNNPSQKVTWSASPEGKVTVDENGLVTGKEIGSVTITATSKADTSKSGQITLTVKSASTEVDNAIVPEYTGPAKGPEAGAKSITYKLNGADIPVGTL